MKQLPSAHLVQQLLMLLSDGYALFNFVIG